MRKVTSSSELLALMSELQTLKEQAIKELHVLYNCDILLCPAFPIVAPLNGSYLPQLLPAFAYTLYWNVLDMPSGVVPYGLVNSDEASYRDAIHDTYEYYARIVMKDSAGMPVGVQVVGKCNQDELVLRVMRELQDKIKFKLPAKFES